MKRLLTLLFGFVLVIWLGNPAYAQGSSLQISPTVTKLPVKAGETVAPVLTVKNSGKTAVTVTVSMVDFEADPKTAGAPKLLPDGGNEKYSLHPWFKGQETLSIGAGQTINYLAKIAVPKSVAERTYFGSVVFTPQNSGQAQTASVGSLVFLTAGAPDRSIEISDLSFDKKTGSFTAELKNNGEGLYDEGISLTIRDSSGNEQILKPESSGAVLPESSRRFSFKSNNPLPEEKLTITAAAGADNAVTRELIVDRTPDRTPTDVKPEAGSSEKSPPPVIFIILGLAALLALVGAVLFVRRGRKKDNSVQAAPIQSADALSSGPDKDTDKPTDPFQNP